MTRRDEMLGKFRPRNRRCLAISGSRHLGKFRIKTRRDEMLGKTQFDSGRRRDVNTVVIGVSRRRDEMLAWTETEPNNVLTVILLLVF